MLNSLFAFLDGKPYTLNGVSGTLEHRWFYDRHGLLRQELNHIPDEKGKETETYREVRRQLKDDYVTCLTENIDRYCEIGVELGYWKENP